MIRLVENIEVIVFVRTQEFLGLTDRFLLDYLLVVPVPKRVRSESVVRSTSKLYNKMQNRITESEKKEEYFNQRID
jgi:hypothetical protein